MLIKLSDILITILSFIFILISMFNGKTISNSLDCDGGKNTEIEELENIIDAGEIEIIKMEEEIDAGKNEISELKETILAGEKEIDVLKEKMWDKNKDYKKIQNNISSKEDIINNKNEEIAYLKAGMQIEKDKINKLEKEVKSGKVEIEMLMDEIEAGKKMYQNEIDKNSSLNFQNKNLDNELKSTIDNNNKQNNHILAGDEKILKYKEELASANRQIEALKDYNKNLHNMNERFKTVIEGKDKVIENFTK